MVKQRRTEPQAVAKKEAIHDPVTRAYAMVIRRSKRAKALQSAMAPEVLREMALGRDATNDMFQSSQPYFFANRVGLTYKAEMRKMDRVSLDVALGSVAYDFCASTVENELDTVTGLYQPDLLGKTKSAVMYSELEKKLFHCDRESMLGKDSKTGLKSADMSSLVHADISADQARHLFSLVCLRNTYLKDKVTSFVQSNLGQEYPRVKEAVGILLQLTAPAGRFCHETLSFDAIPTADYTLHISKTRHHFKAINNEYGWEVQKTIILASTHGARDQHIPICEELSIQFKTRNGSGTKGAPALINIPKCCVISCAMSDPVILQHAQMHFFGVNAFSVAFAGENPEKLPTDKTRICARLAGTLVKHLNDMHSTDITKVQSSVEFFSGMFSRDYTIDPVDSNEYRAKLTTKEKDGASVFIKAEAEKIPKPQGADPELITRTLNSFLKRQNVRNFIASDTGGCCNIVKWMTSQTFSVLSLSPYQTPHLKYVFILTYSSPLNRITYGIRDKPLFKALAPDDIGVRAFSMLTPDLEDELKAFSQ
jgi:hypothetical protein